MLIQFWKRRKKQCVSIVCSISILFSSIFFLNGCEATFLEEKKSSKEVENERFTSFTEKLFCKEVAASQISLHYTLKEPEAYGIDKVTKEDYERNLEENLANLVKQQRRIYSRHCIHFLMKN